MKINCESEKGGSVTLNAAHGITASYAVATVADNPAPEILYVWAKLPNGKRVQLFLNRETGLCVVDVVNKRETGGNEVFRMDLNRVKV